MGDWGWVTNLLQLLFGQLGVLGTVCFLFMSYIAWQLDVEQKLHRETRRRYEELNERRLQVFDALANSIKDLKVSVDSAITINNRNRK